MFTDMDDIVEEVDVVVRRYRSLAIQISDLEQRGSRLMKEVLDVNAKREQLVNELRECEKELRRAALGTLLTSAARDPEYDYLRSKVVR